MKRPWQVWLIFLACLAMVLPAMVWLSRMALDLDRAEALARRQADLEEAVGSALWQMDSELTRLLAPEIARPPFFYQPFYSVADGRGGTQQVPSPLLMQPSPYVRLHFEVRPDGTWTSPQCPGGGDYSLALTNEVSAGNIDLSRERLQALSEMVPYEALADQVPEQTLQIAAVTPSPWAGNSAFPGSLQQSQVVKNVLDYEQIKQQLESVQQADAAASYQQPPAQAPSPANAGADLRQRVQTRRGSELQSRSAALQAAAQQAIWDQRLNLKSVVPVRLATEGVSQPVWVGSELLLARRVESGSASWIQGCWLDWPRIRQELLRQVAPFLPEAELEPVTDIGRARLTRVLATLPVQLVVPAPAVVVNPLSPIRVSLVAAWLFLGLATVAMTILLRGVVTLSERRAAFVSAVTHELRTPLTTFRMYAEMLAEGMVTDAEQRRSYLETLRVEADRLAHLVENVLQYARLERGSNKRRREETCPASLLERVEPRLAERARQAEMTVEIEVDDRVRGEQIHTDPAAIEQILFNLVDNACKYAVGAEDGRIHVRLESRDGKLLLRVQDHGPGIAASERRQLFRPFSKSAKDAANSAPGVGLGLALCRRLAAQLGGRLEVECSPGNGAVFTLTLPRS
jgi:signal transduction histidine kinase